MTLPFDQPALVAPHANTLARPAGGGTPGLRPRRALAALVVFVAALHAGVVWCVWQGHATKALVPPDLAMDVSLLMAEPSPGQPQRHDLLVEARQLASQDGARPSMPRVVDAGPVEAAPRERARADMAAVPPRAEMPSLPGALSAPEAQGAPPVAPPATMAPQSLSNQVAARTGGTAEASQAAMVPRHLPSSAVSFAVPPVKVYPEASRSLDESGVVQVAVLVDEKGLAAEVRVERSSGYSRLDRAAVTAARGTRFNPYVESGSARAFWVTIPFNFDLED